MDNRPVEMEPQGVQVPGTPPGHESYDVSFRAIFLFSAAVIATFIAVVFALGAVMGAFSRDEEALEAQRPPMFADEAGQFPAPRLQGNPPSDMARYAAQEREALSGPIGWVDRKAGIAHIPIERAMQIVAEKGLPTRPARKATDAK